MGNTLMACDISSTNGRTNDLPLSRGCLRPFNALWSETSPAWYSLHVVAKSRNSIRLHPSPA
jgi:hypothetical protein